MKQELTRVTLRIMITVATLLAVGCRQKDEIVAYDAPKEPDPVPAPVAPTAHAPNTHSATGLTWTAPEGWQEEPGSGSIRAATFRAGDESNQMTVTVTRLSGSGGGLLANVNRWRSQLELPPIAQEDLGKMTRPVTGGHVSGTLVDLTAAKPEVPGQPPQRMLIGVFPHAGGTWFFKARAPEPRIKEHEAAFFELLRSVRSSQPSDEQRHASNASPSAGMQPASDVASAASGKPQAYDAGSVSGTVPGLWKRDPKSSRMRVATFVIPQGSQRAEVTITRFPGDVGGALANINRWRSQVGLAPVKDVSEQKSTPINVGGQPGKLYQFTPAADQTGICVASVRYGANTWFFKMKGPSDLIKTQLKPFIEFITSTKFSAGGNS